MQYLTKGKGIKGSIKQSAEAFSVNEITKNGTVLRPGRIYSALELGESEGGKFVKFVLEKHNWNTVQALEKIGRMVGRGRKSLGYAGMKDRISSSVQLASIYGAELEKLRALKLKDISINGAWNSETGVKLGDLLGNNFDIKIEHVEGNAAQNAMATLEELNGLMPNYFDKQRFGSRQNNAKVGLHMLAGNFRDAVLEFLLNTDNEKNAEAIEARRRLAEEMDFSKALEYFPKYLKYERKMIAYLSKYENFANAIRILPRGIALLFVHAVEDTIFNAALDFRIEQADFGTKVYAGIGTYQFPDMGSISESGTYPVAPLIGYDTNERYIGDYELKAMRELGISKEMFKVKGMPELSMKGSFRCILAPVRDTNIAEEDEGGSLRIGFSLPAGSYATVLLDEIMKNGQQ